MSHTNDHWAPMLLLMALVGVGCQQSADYCQESGQIACEDCLAATAAPEECVLEDSQYYSTLGCTSDTYTTAAYEVGWTIDGGCADREGMGQ